MSESISPDLPTIVVKPTPKKKRGKRGETKPKKFLKLRESACILVDKEVRTKLGWSFETMFKLTVEGQKLVVEQVEE